MSEVTPVPLYVRIHFLAVASPRQSEPLAVRIGVSREEAHVILLLQVPHLHAAWNALHTAHFIYIYICIYMYIYVYICICMYIYV